MKPTNNIGFLLQHLAFMLARRNDTLLQDNFGVGFSQFKLLMVLKWKPHIRQKEIASQLGQTEASISRQIKLMLEDGLLQSRQRPENRRERIAVLTPRGERICNEAIEKLDKQQQPMFDSLSSSQQKQLLELLGVLHEYIVGSDKASKPLFSDES